jgi:multicomponent Na+:H+ antiporter subunit G
MEWVRAALVIGLVSVGTALLLIAAVGTLRLPDIFLRMSATSKASSLGASCLLLALAAASADIGISVRALAGTAFLLLTTPVAAHMIGRAAYVSRTPLWKGTIRDDLRGQYDRDARTLAAGPNAPAPPPR